MPRANAWLPVLWGASLHSYTWVYYFGHLRTLHATIASGTELAGSTKGDQNAVVEALFESIP
jgi:hypothetical protein